MRSVASVPKAEYTPRRSRVRRSMGFSSIRCCIVIAQAGVATARGVDQAAGLCYDLSYHMMTDGLGESSPNGSIEPKLSALKLIDDPAASGSPVVDRRARRPAHGGYHQRQDRAWFPIA